LGSNIAHSNSANTDSITDFVSGTDKLQVTLDYSMVSASLDISTTRSSAGVAGTSLAQDTLTGQRGQYVYDTAASALYINFNNDNLLTAADFKIAINAASTASATIADGDIIFNVTGGSAADTIVGGAGADTIDGAAGADSISGGAGDDNLTAGAGVDTIVGGAGDDTIALGGGTDADVIVTGASSSANGADTITGFVVGAGGDILNFGAFFTEDGTSIADTDGTQPGASVNATNNVVVLIDIAGNQDILTAAGLTTALAAGGEYSNYDMTASTKAVAITYAGGATTTAKVFYLTSDASAVITATLVGTITTDATTANLADGNFV